MKTLYFEGAGCWGTSATVGNCRIRTAFTADDGREWYLEIVGFEPSKEQEKAFPELKAHAEVARVEHCFEIEGGPDDCNENRHPCERSAWMPYTLDAIREFVNRELGCSFDAVAVAPRFSRYRAHKKGAMRGYNLANGYEPDAELIARAEAIYEEQRENQKAAGEEWPCVAVWWDEDEERTLHVRGGGKKGGKSFDVRF